MKMGTARLLWNYEITIKKEGVKILVRIQILRRIYDGLEISSYRPKSQKYGTISNKTEHLHGDLKATLNSEQRALLKEYTTLIYEQVLMEQRLAFYHGVQVGVGFVREVQFLKRGRNKCS